MRTSVVALTLLCVGGCAFISERNSDDRTPFRSGAEDVGGTTMHYEVFGIGVPILLIHAGIADCRMWDEQVDSLSTGYMLIRCDLRGFGRTPRGSRPFSHYHDIAVLLDSLRISRAHVVGVSFGASVAVDLALAFPERIRSLTLCAPAISGAMTSPEVLRIDSTEGALLNKGDRESAAELMVRTWVVGAHRPPNEVSSILQQKVKEMQLHNYAIPFPIDAQSVSLEPRAMTRLEKIAAPTLVMIGDKDVESFQELSVVVANGIPKAKRVVIPDAAHLINMEMPAVFNQMLIDFIADK